MRGRAAGVPRGIAFLGGPRSARPCALSFVKTPSSLDPCKFPWPHGRPFLRAVGRTTRTSTRSFSGPARPSTRPYQGIEALPGLADSSIERRWPPHLLQPAVLPRSSAQYRVMRSEHATVLPENRAFHCLSRRPRGGSGSRPTGGGRVEGGLDAVRRYDIMSYRRCEMAREKVAVTLDAEMLGKLDRLVRRKKFAS